MPSKEHADTCVPWKDPGSLPQSRSPTRSAEGAGGGRAPAGWASVVGSTWWTAREPGRQGPLAPALKPAWGEAGRSTSRLPGSPPTAPSPLWARSRRPGRGPACPAPYKVYWGAHIVRKTPLLPPPPQNKASPSLEGERTGMLWRVQPGASSDIVTRWP